MIIGMMSLWRRVAITLILTMVSAKILAFTPTLECGVLRRPRQPKQHGLGAKKKAKRGGAGSGGGGFGAASPAKTPSKKKAARGKGRADLRSALDDDGATQPRQEKSFSRTYVKSDQERLLAELAASSAQTVIGRAIAKSPAYNSPEMDPFWQMLPSLLSTKFPRASDADLERVAGMVEFSMGARELLEDDVIADAWRPHEELHAYMPGLGAATPFLDPGELALCQQLSDNYAVIAAEYEALLTERFDRKGKDRFQSVTSMVNQHALVPRLSDQGNDKWRKDRRAH
jgi:hypothetical protein